MCDIKFADDIFSLQGDYRTFILLMKADTGNYTESGAARPVLSKSKVSTGRFIRSRQA